MIERNRRAETIEQVRETVLDDRILHMTDDEVQDYLDAYLRKRGLLPDGCHADMIEDMDAHSD